MCLSAKFPREGGGGGGGRTFFSSKSMSFCDPSVISEQFTTSPEPPGGISPNFNGMILELRSSVVECSTGN